MAVGGSCVVAFIGGIQVGEGRRDTRGFEAGPTVCQVRPGVQRGPVLARLQMTFFKWWQAPSSSPQRAELENEMLRLIRQLKPTLTEQQALNLLDLTNEAHEALGEGAEAARRRQELMSDAWVNFRRALLGASCA